MPRVKCLTTLLTQGLHVPLGGLPLTQANGFVTNQLPITVAAGVAETTACGCLELVIVLNNLHLCSPAMTSVGLRPIRSLDKLLTGLMPKDAMAGLQKCRLLRTIIGSKQPQAVVSAMQTVTNQLPITVSRSSVSVISFPK